ncbi:MAG: hypothetical protein GX434_17680 [Peptococcaceae bacterium]|nr:hypothetical protein [Peptococcaceae bacterium]
MNTKNIVRESKTIMMVTLVIGIILFAAGAIFRLMDINIVPNKAITGLSFIPLTVAFTHYVKISRIKKSPQKMKSMIINESDERLVALKNEADANS